VVTHSFDVVRSAVYDVFMSLLERKKEGGGKDHPEHNPVIPCLMPGEEKSDYLSLATY